MAGGVFVDYLVESVIDRKQLVATRKFELAESVAQLEIGQGNRSKVMSDQNQMTLIEAENLHVSDVVERIQEHHQGFQMRKQDQQLTSSSVMRLKGQNASSSSNSNARAASNSRRNVMAFSI